MFMEHTNVFLHRWGKGTGKNKVIVPVLWNYTPVSGRRPKVTVRVKCHHSNIKHVFYISYMRDIYIPLSRHPLLIIKKASPLIQCNSRAQWYPKVSLKLFW